jgi:hypothetical protein
MIILGLLLVIAFLLFFPQGKRSYYESGPTGTVVPAAGVNAVADMAAVDATGDDVNVSDISGAGLIPSEVSVNEDFGAFSPDNILSGQNFMDPRSQIGYPETLGGVLRNANRQIRSEPLNPRDSVSIFNLSTIPPDTMRPKFEIDFEYQ